MDRQYDVVVFGATGFTGALTAQYLAQHADPGTRWAVAGRNADKLKRALETIEAPDVPVVIADTTDAKSMRAMAASAKVVLTTVGPYIELGEPLVDACATEGTAYVDLTGEPEFMDLMYVRHHRRAQDTGARIIHACGFDSIPQDLGVHFTVQQLPEDVPIHVDGFVRAGGSASGGTVASALGIMGRFRQARKAHAERLRAEPSTPGRTARAVIGKPRRESGVGWLLPMPTIDPEIVRQSASALERYGPDFSYSPYIAVKRLPAAAGLAGGVGGLFALAQLPPARKLISSRIPQGTGPSPEQRAKSWFKLTFHGTGGSERVVTEVSGGDPGYGETSKMLAESALCLAHDDLPDTAGQVTTAQAMGDALRERLVRAGIRFEIRG